MPISAIDPATLLIAAPSAQADGALAADRRRRTPRPATVVLIATAALASGLALMTLSSAEGAADTWLRAQWSITAAGAFAAALLGWRPAWRQRRVFPTWTAIVLGVLLLEQLALDAAVIAGSAGLLTVAHVLSVIVAIPLAAWVFAGPPTDDRPARWAKLIDAAAVAVAISGVLLARFGADAEAIGGLDGFVAIASLATFIAAAGAGFVVLVEESGILAVRRPAVLMVVGLALLGCAAMGRLSSRAAGIDLPTGGVLDQLVPIALVLMAAAAVFGRPTPADRRAAHGGPLSVLIPIVTALGSAAVILLLDDRLNGVVELALRGAVSVTIVLVVVRQTLLLSDRRVTAERAHDATLRAEQATQDARLSAQLQKAAEERFRRLVEQIPAAVYLDRLDMSSLAISETVYISPRVEEITGFSPAEIAADNSLWLDRVHEDDRDEMVATWDRHCAEDEPFSATYRFRRKDGEYVWLAEDATILVDDSGARFSQGLVVDITERQETEARLRQAQKMEAVGQLAGGVAHDFNNLLTVITGHAGLLRETTDEDDPARVDIEAIGTAAASSADLVGQLLAFGRRQMLRPEVVDLTAIVGDVLPMLRRLLPEHIDVVTTLARDLPAIRADPGQIQQVVLNLAINGRDAMPSGGTLRIETEARTIGRTEAARHLGLTAGSYVQLTIADGGIGMDATTRDRIFEPFFTTKAAGRGTGLGLATVYGIVKQSGGYISLDSAVDRGSTFRVLLPATADRVARRRLMSSTGTPGGHERIVLCEDEPAVRDLVAVVLRRAGYTVVTATNPTEALLHVADQQSPADLLLTDVVMPGMSGPDLARRATTLRPNLRVVLMSGYALDARDREAVGRQAGYLAKPFTPAGLTRTVRDVLDGVPVGPDGSAALDRAAAGSTQG